MSQLASFYIVGRDQVPELEASGPQEIGRELDPFEWSGYAFAVVLAYLDEQGVPLMDSEFDDAAIALAESQDAAVFIFTPAHKSYLPKLDPAQHSEDQLRPYYEEFNEIQEPEAGTWMRAALEALHRHIGGLDDSSVLVLIVG